MQADTTISTDNFTRDVKTTFIEKQKVFQWVRVFLKEEDNSFKAGDDITIKYLPTGEEILTKFGSYSKDFLGSDKTETIQYSPDDNKKVLCLMVDLDEINDPKESSKIPFIRTLFKTGRWYQYQLMKRDELLVCKSDGSKIIYFDINF